MSFVLTQEQLAKILPKNKAIVEWLPLVNELLDKYEINSKERVAAFLAQTAHESLEFTILTENLNYSADSLCKVWPRRFPSLTEAQPFHRNPQKIANRVYSSRLGNSDEASGDGWKYRGRGLIQLTGKDNYSAFANSMNIGLDEAVLYLDTKRGALESACWFWKKNNLNVLADAQDIVALSKKINGGTIGLVHRQEMYKLAMEVL